MKVKKDENNALEVFFTSKTHKPNVPFRAETSTWQHEA